MSSSSSPPTIILGQQCAIGTPPPPPPPPPPSMSPPAEVPSEPSPSDDAGAGQPDRSARQQQAQFATQAGDVDIFVIEPETVVGLMCHSLEMIMRMTGQTPPGSSPESAVAPNLRDQQKSPETVAGQPGDVQAQTVPTSAPDVGSTPETEAAGVGAGAGAGVENNPRRPSIDSGQPIGDEQDRLVSGVFSGSAEPPFGIEKYFLHAYEHCPVSPAAVMATSYYMHRLVVAEQRVVLTGRNVHRLLLGAVIVAAKAYDDKYPRLRILSRAGGVSISEMRRLLLGFCYLLDFDLWVSAETLTRHVRWLRKMARPSG